MELPVTGVFEVHDGLITLLARLFRRGDDHVAIARRIADLSCLTTARRAKSRSTRGLARAVARRWPGLPARVFRVAAAHVLAHIGPGALPEAGQILGELHRPVARGTAGPGSGLSADRGMR